VCFETNARKITKVDRAEWLLGPPFGVSLEYTDNPRTNAVDRRSTPSARADRQEPLPMLRCPGCRVFPDHPDLNLALVQYPPPLTTESPTTHYCTVQNHVPIDP